MALSEPIDLILVPQGAEYRAVVMGLRRSALQNLPSTLAIPVGPVPVMSFLLNLRLEMPTIEQQRSFNIVIMGVCGGLLPSVNVGQRVIPDTCLTQFSAETFADSIPDEQPFSPSLSQSLKDVLLPSEPSAAGQTLLVSSDRTVCLATQKQQLQQMTGATVVDMEGAAVLAAFRERPVSVAMLRVVSDDCTSDLPNLNAAVNSDGSLSVLQLTLQMLRHPVRARQLIASSLRALGELSTAAEELGKALHAIDCSTDNGELTARKT